MRSTYFEYPYEYVIDYVDFYGKEPHPLQYDENAKELKPQYMYYVQTDNGEWIWDSESNRRKREQKQRDEPFDIREKRVLRKWDKLNDIISGSKMIIYTGDNIPKEFSVVIH